jgi:hypothetical protein
MGITCLAAHGPAQSNDCNSSPAATVLDIGCGPILLICGHASNHVPAQRSDLGLRRDHLDDHIGWNIGVNLPFVPIEGVYFATERLATTRNRLYAPLDGRNELPRGPRHRNGAEAGEPDQNCPSISIGGPN